MLYFIASPIGNLNDISLRSIEVLKKIDFIYAEDTRNTKKLLNLINADGECYLTQTIIDKKFVIRVSIGTFETTREDVMAVHTIANKFYNIVVKKA